MNQKNFLQTYFAMLKVAVKAGVFYGISLETKLFINILCSNRISSCAHLDHWSTPQPFPNIDPSCVCTVFGPHLQAIVDAIRYIFELLVLSLKL